MATIPSVNISDSHKAFEVSVELPGLDRNDVKLEINDNCLSISTEKQYNKEENNGNWMRREYGYASFQRMFQLPNHADPEKIDAQMNAGILRVNVGKKKEVQSESKRIAVA